jgi:hypothetical protein
MAGFQGRHPEGVTADVLEVRYPPALWAERTAAAAARLLDAAVEQLQAAPGAPRLIALEAPWDDPVRLCRLAEALARANAGNGIRWALKIRTGGLDAAAVPPPDAVATFLVTAAEAGVPLKATAGLHHPVRRHAPSVSAPMHGFFNLFVGGVLLHAGAIGKGELVALLLDEDAASFRFGSETVAWRDHAASLDAIVRARDAFVLSFGSCSFIEPWEDLHALRLVDSPPPV